MELTKVNSANLDYIGYDERRGDLIVRFKTGIYYRYFNVPFGIYENLMKSTSKGAYFSHWIKTGYNCEKVNMAD